MKIGFPSDVVALGMKVSYDRLMALSARQIVSVAGRLNQAPIEFLPW